MRPGPPFQEFLGKDLAGRDFAILKQSAKKEIVEVASVGPLVSHSDRRGAVSGQAPLAAPPHGLIQINTRRGISD